MDKKNDSKRVICIGDAIIQLQLEDVIVPETLKEHQDMAQNKDGEKNEQQ